MASVKAPVVGIVPDQVRSYQTLFDITQSLGSSTALATSGRTRSNGGREVLVGREHMAQRRMTVYN